MKITKRQLRRIIKEEKARLISEQPISPEQGEQMQMQKEWRSALDYFSSGAGMMKKFASSQSSPYSTASQWGQGNEANDLADVLQEIWESAGFDPREIFK